MRLWPIAFALLVSGCAPRTDDPLIDRVVAGLAPFAPCVRVGETRVFSDGGKLGPPAMLTPNAFRTEEVRRAAANVAVPWSTAGVEKVSLFGRGTAGECRTAVDRPLRSGNFAFVSYSEPGGTIGAIAFRRQDGDWQQAEEVRLGYW